MPNTVHPRVGGEQDQHVDGFDLQPGSSPRGRGTVVRDHRNSHGRRFIPAWAGNRCLSMHASRSTTVHPRVGGEQPIPSTRPNSASGSSPRGRGTGSRSHIAAPCHRFIPAWAGNSLQRCSNPHRGAVHPRVGGEQSAVNDESASLAGSSPRGRGTVLAEIAARLAERFIPAWAGNSLRSSNRWRCKSVHPRVGGEQCRSTSILPQGRGSSPRGRGTELFLHPGIRIGRFIPAWAGNRQHHQGLGASPAVHPRVGGEQTVQLCARLQLGGSSPLGRGTVRRRSDPRMQTRFIPAWAGNRPPGSGIYVEPPVHPRVGGEQPRRAR